MTSPEPEIVETPEPIPVPERETSDEGSAPVITQQPQPTPPGIPTDPGEDV